MDIFILTFHDDTSWTHYSKTYNGTFSSEDKAYELIPDWAKRKKIEDRYDRENSVVARYGSDGISYSITKSILDVPVNMRK